MLLPEPLSVNVLAKLNYALNPLPTNTSVLKKKGNPVHLQCEKLLGLAGGNTKKHGNKKSAASAELQSVATYVIMNMYMYTYSI